MELVLEQTQQGTSYEVSVSTEGVEELKRKVKINGEKKEALLTLRQKPEHLSDTIHSEDGNPVLANIKIALGIRGIPMVVAIRIKTESRFNTTCSYLPTTSKDINESQVHVSRLSYSDTVLADIFTKALASERFEFLIKRLGMQSITPEELIHLAESDEE
ncbi:hypothetical protein Tco_1418516 [Tanacetum coccineum]